MGGRRGGGRQIAGRKVMAGEETQEQRRVTEPEEME